MSLCTANVTESETGFFNPDTPRRTFGFVKDAAGQAYLVVKLDGAEVARVKKIK
ncbi:MAG TPA: hypothetical protein VFS77_10435 [Pyrinomonadaceae bacterium]|nr:hypothetical protein [Pyrinomonadaceae bacterium]